MESGNVTCNERINAINLAEEVKEHSWNKTLSELEEKVKKGTATFNKRIDAMDQTHQKLVEIAKKVEWEERLSELEKEVEQIWGRMDKLKSD